MDDVVMYHVIFRRRDPHTGKLIRGDVEELPDHVKVDAAGMRVLSGAPVSFERMFEQVNPGVTDKKKAWSDYKSEQYAAAARMLADLEEQQRQAWAGIEKRWPKKTYKGNVIPVENVKRYNDDMVIRGR